jgi:microcystin-dependent protein
MSAPYVGEIKIVAFNFPPKGWAFCDGQTMSIQQNAALFSLLGTSYGGNGTQTFALPNLQGQVPIHMSGNFPQGAVGGELAHTLLTPEMPMHNHQLNAISGAASQTDPTNGLLAATTDPLYQSSSNLVGMNPQSVTPMGGSQPHNNMQPYLVLSFVIALQGIYPSRN